MSISVLNIAPQAPASANGPAPSSGGGTNGSPSDGFGGLLAALAAPQSASATQEGPAAPAASASGAKDQLTQALSALAGGQVDLGAAGLGLTSQQLQTLLGNLKKLLDGNTGDGAALLASLLAASQLAGTIQPNDLAALTQLLGTTAQGTVSVDALASNLHLLAQAVQAVAGSGGTMTLTQAVQELTSPGDAFTQLLTAAIAQPATPTATSEAPATVDTGPPQGQSPGDAAGQTAPATAGSNGRELTVTPTGATSPADGAAQGASSPEVSDLAKAIEALLQTQPQPKATPAGTSTPAGQPAASRAQAGAGSVQPAAQQAPAAQLAQMSPVAAASPTTAAVQTATAAVTSQAAAAAPNAAPNPIPEAQPVDPKAADSSDGATTAKTLVVGADAVAGVTPQTGDQDQASGNGAGQQPASNAIVAGQAAAAQAAAATAPGTFAAVLDASASASASSSARPGVEQAVLDQVVQSATLALNSGQQEFRIQLKPEFLGAIEVRVSVDNGVVDVRMSVESAATRQLIDNNISQLRQAFGGGDVRVQQVPTFASSDAAWTFAQGGQQHGFWQGQNPFAGGPLPEAIPFNEPAPDEAALAAAAVGAAPQGSATPAAPGAVDIQA